MKIDFKKIVSELKNTPVLTMAGIAVTAFVAWCVLKNKLGKKSETVISYSVGVTKMSDNQAQTYAVQLYDAMRSYGTDNKMIERILDVCQKDVGGLGKIYNAFGRKDYGFFGSPVWNPFKESVDLREWLRRELKSRDFAPWDALFNQLNGYGA